MDTDRIAALEARIATLEREVAAARSAGAERIGEVMDPERGHVVPSAEQFAEQLTVQLVSLLSRSGVDLRKAWLDIRHTFDGDPGVGAREVFGTFELIFGGPKDGLEPIDPAPEIADDLEKIVRDLDHAIEAGRDDQRIILDRVESLEMALHQVAEAVGAGDVDRAKLGVRVAQLDRGLANLVEIIKGGRREH